MRNVALLVFSLLAACSRAAAVAPVPAAPPSEPLAVPSASPSERVDTLESQLGAGERFASPAFAALLDESQPIARFAWIAERGRCDRVVARASGAIRLVVRDGRAKSLAEASSERDVVVQHCSRGSGPSFVDATGSGMLSLRIFAGEKQVLAPSGPRVHAPSAPIEQDELARRIMSQAQSAAPGARKLGAIFRARATDQKTDWTQHLDAGRCYTFVGAGGDGLKQLGLYLWSPTGEKMTFQRAAGPNAVMYHCTKAAGPYRFQAKQNNGKGDYAVGLFVKG